MEKNISKYLAFRWMALYMLFCDDDLDRADFAPVSYTHLFRNALLKVWLESRSLSSCRAISCAGSWFPALITMWYWRLLLNLMQ